MVKYWLVSIFFIGIFTSCSSSKENEQAAQNTLNKDDQNALGEFSSDDVIVEWPKALEYRSSISLLPNPKIPVTSLEFYATAGEVVCKENLFKKVDRRMNINLVFESEGIHTLCMRVAYKSGKVETIQRRVVFKTPQLTAISQSLKLLEDSALEGKLGAEDDIEREVTFSITKEPINGVLKFDKISATFSYTPKENFYGSDFFEFSAATSYEKKEQIANGRITLTVSPVRDDLKTNSQTLSTTEDNFVSAGIIVKNVEQDQLLFEIQEQAKNGEVTLESSASNRFTYQPSPNFNGTDSFRYRVRASELNEVKWIEGQIDITVTAVNDEPSSADFTMRTREDETVIIDLSSHVLDIDSSTLYFHIIEQPTHGSIDTINLKDGKLSYSPHKNYQGTDSLKFGVSDIDSAVAMAISEVSIYVENTDNDPPEGTPLSYTFEEDSSSNSIFLSAKDPEGDENLSFHFEGQADQQSFTHEHGVFQKISASGDTWNFQPRANYYGTFQVNFIANDHAHLSEPIPLSITVNPLNDTPLVEEMSLSTDEDRYVTFSYIASDVDGPETPVSFFHSVTAEEVTDISDPFSTANGGVIRKTSENRFVYSPRQDFNGVDEWYVRIRSNQDGEYSNVSKIQINIQPQQDKPVAIDQTPRGLEDSKQIDIQLAAFDVDNDELSYEILNFSDAFGTIKQSAEDPALWHYLPTEDLNGTITFAFRAFDGIEYSNTASVNVDLEGVNDPPTTSNVSFQLKEDHTLETQLPGDDVDNDPLTYTLLSNSPVREATVSQSGFLKVVPILDSSETITGRFRVSDSSGLYAEGMFTINVEPVNDPPMYQGPSRITVPYGRPFEVDNLLRDVDSDTFTFELVEELKYGTLQLMGNGFVYTYKPEHFLEGRDDEIKIRYGDERGPMFTRSITVRASNPTRTTGGYFAGNYLLRVGNDISRCRTTLTLLANVGGDWVPTAIYHTKRSSKLIVRKNYIALKYGSCGAAFSPQTEIIAIDENAHSLRSKGILIDGPAYSDANYYYDDGMIQVHGKDFFDSVDPNKEPYSFSAFDFRGDQIEFVGRFDVDKGLRNYVGGSFFSINPLDPTTPSPKSRLRIETVDQNQDLLERASVDLTFTNAEGSEVFASSFNEHFVAIVAEKSGVYGNRDHMYFFNKNSDSWQFEHYHSMGTLNHETIAMDLSSRLLAVQFVQPPRDFKGQGSIIYLYDLSNGVGSIKLLGAKSVAKLDSTWLSSHFIPGIKLEEDGVKIDDLAFGESTNFNLCDGECPADDPDGDGVLAEDNCPDHYNPLNIDTDKDGIGDRCDYNDDNDGLIDIYDNCPLVASEDTTDSDQDGIGDICDKKDIVSKDVSCSTNRANCISASCPVGDLIRLKSTVLAPPVPNGEEYGQPSVGLLMNKSGAYYGSCSPGRQLIQAYDPKHGRYYKYVDDLDAVCTFTCYREEEQ